MPNRLEHKIDTDDDEEEVVVLHQFEPYRGLHLFMTVH